MRSASWLVVLALGCCGVVVTPSHSDAVDYGNQTVSRPEIYSLRVESTISFRFAHTVVSCRIANSAGISQEASFSAVLPDTAFISGFLMELDDQVYHGYVREKEAARQVYMQAVREGGTAAHVALSARDSNRFTVTVNVEPQKKVTFNLTYEELLGRKLGTYKHVINLDPGQIVRDLSVEVRINESADITTLNVPSLRTSNEIDSNPTDAGETNSLVTIERLSPQSAVIKFVPTPDQQRDLAIDGIKGQLVVEYDVNRTEHSTQILVNDGYFVHFFAPTDLPALRKQVTFVLDVSGSMRGRKIEQLKQAMKTILSDLNSGDLFSIVLFSSQVEVWDSAITPAANMEIMHTLGSWHPSDRQRNLTLTPSVVATASTQTIANAKTLVDLLDTVGATNINGALMAALDISKLGRTSEQVNNEFDPRPDPIIIFLTDGQPNVGVSQPSLIVSGVTAANTGNSSIFCLALGDDADFNFLKKLSIRNTGFARKIYEASDTALQLRDFYRQVASPLLTNVTFKYQEEEVAPDSLTRVAFRRFFSGSELVVAGRVQGVTVTGGVSGRALAGPSLYPVEPVLLPTPSPVANSTPGTTERLWAYLSIQQLLEDDDAKDTVGNQTSPEHQRALQLALHYSFVTPLTSLVVVKPNDTSAVDTEDAALQDYSSLPLFDLVAGGLQGPVASFVSVPRVMSASYPASMGLPIPGPASLGRIPGPSQLYQNPVNRLSGSAVPGASGGISLSISVPTLRNISDVTWLPDNNTISVNLAGFGTHADFEIARSNETNIAAAACLSPSYGFGHCRHFRYCVLSDFVNDRNGYLPYFCEINGYAGVCCPDSLTP